jgi:uncharacterized protein (DUF305 family)
MSTMNFTTTAGAALIGMALAGVTAASMQDGERLFLAANQQIMDTMMTEMAPKATGDVDADFAAMMIPHHQGAIEMAVLELRYGRNEQLRRIAQEIIVDQQQEIAAMHLAVAQPFPPTSAPSRAEPLPTTSSAAAPAVRSQKDLPK